MKETKEAKLYSTPFSLNYWKDACHEFKNLRSLVFAALLCALAIVIEYFQIPVSQSVYISMSFLIISLCSMLTGPVMAIPCGIIVDLIGYVIKPSGAFFPGYTLTAVLTAFVYAIFLYRSNLSFARIALSKTIINLFINTLLGSVWRIALYGKSPFLYYILISGVKNLILLPLEIFLICLLFQALLAPMKKLKVIPEEVNIKFTVLQIIIIAVLSVVGIIALILFVTNYDALKAFFQAAVTQ